MFQIFQNSFLGFLTADNLLIIITGLVIIAVMLVADRLIRRAIARYSKRLRLEKHVENVFKLIARIVVFAAGMVALLQFFGMPTEWFLGVSACARDIEFIMRGKFLIISDPSCY